MAATRARDALGASTLSISRWEIEEGVLRTLINIGDDEQMWPVDEVYPLEDFPAAIALLQAGQPHVTWIDDEDTDPAELALLRELGADSSAAVPIVYEGRTWGELYATTAAGDPRLSESDVAYMHAICGQIGLALGRAELFSRLSTLAFEDPLTGLPNRRAAEERLEQLAARAEPVSLLLGDLDGLKAINDKLGHDAGDAALRATADALRTAVAGDPGITPVRLGGDEFCVILPGRHDRRGGGVRPPRLGGAARGRRRRDLLVGRGRELRAGLAAGAAAARRRRRAVPGQAGRRRLRAARDGAGGRRAAPARHAADARPRGRRAAADRRRGRVAGRRGPRHARDAPARGRGRAGLRGARRRVLVGLGGHGGRRRAPHRGPHRPPRRARASAWSASTTSTRSTPSRARAARCRRATRSTSTPRAPGAEEAIGALLRSTGRSQVLAGAAGDRLVELFGDAATPPMDWAAAAAAPAGARGYVVCARRPDQQLVHGHVRAAARRRTSPRGRCRRRRARGSSACCRRTACRRPRARSASRARPSRSAPGARPRPSR